MRRILAVVALAAALSAPLAGCVPSPPVVSVDKKPDIAGTVVSAKPVGERCQFVLKPNGETTNMTVTGDAQHDLMKFPGLPKGYASKTRMCQLPLAGSSYTLVFKNLAVQYKRGYTATKTASRGNSCTITYAYTDGGKLTKKSGDKHYCRDFKTHKGFDTEVLTAEIPRK